MPGVLTLNSPVCRRCRSGRIGPHRRQAADDAPSVTGLQAVIDHGPWAPRWRSRDLPLTSCTSMSMTAGAGQACTSGVDADCSARSPPASIVVTMTISPRRRVLADAARGRDRLLLLRGAEFLALRLDAVLKAGDGGAELDLPHARQRERVDPVWICDDLR